MNTKAVVRSNEKFRFIQKELDQFLSRFKKTKFVLEPHGIWGCIYERENGQRQCNSSFIEKILIQYSMIDLEEHFFRLTIHNLNMILP